MLWKPFFFQALSQSIHPELQLLAEKKQINKSETGTDTVTWTLETEI